jgi:hypothetical protein
MTVISPTRSALISALSPDCAPRGHGFIAATNMKLAGKVDGSRARLTVATFSSSG